MVSVRRVAAGEASYVADSSARAPCSFTVGDEAAARLEQFPFTPEGKKERLLQCVKTTKKSRSPTRWLETRPYDSSDAAVEVPRKSLKHRS